MASSQLMVKVPHIYFHNGMWHVTAGMSLGFTYQALTLVMRLNAKLRVIGS